MEHFILANVIQFPNVSFPSCSDIFCSICMKYIAMIPNDALYLSFPKSTVVEKAVAPHSSTLAWKIPWTQEPGRLQSMGSPGVGHD